MKIGILTLPIFSNYGGILQAFALQTVLQRLGHDATIINFVTWDTRPGNVFFSISNIRRLINNFIHLKFWGWTIQDDVRRKNEHLNQFIRKNIKQINVQNSEAILKEKFDCYVVGSDQIWRPLYYPEIEHAFLDFTEGLDVVRIAYAPSFGTEKWEYSEAQTRTCKDLLRFFDAVSVREKDGVKKCKEYFDVDAKFVLDPTFLLHDREYDGLTEGKSGLDQEYIFAYILDGVDEKMATMQRVASKLKCKLHVMNISKFEKKQSIGFWLSAIKNAKYILTDSFHACVFSIIYRKEFFVFENSQRGNSRIRSLLDTFDLGGRKIMIDKMEEEIMRAKRIDYEDVSKKLDWYRQESQSFLMKGLLKK